MKRPTRRGLAPCGAALKGFTLIEVLVALAIVALALGAGMKAAGSLSGNAERLQRMSAAQWCAENQLTELKLQRQFPGVGDSEFRCQQLGMEFRGQLQVRATPNPGFRRVDAVVGDEQVERLLAVSTIVGRY